MGSHPVNLGIRFLLELAVFGISGWWGWNQGDGWLSILLAIGTPVILAAMWGIFAVPNDPSRSGSAPIIIPGIIRLILELAIFGFGFWALYDLDHPRMSLTIGGIVLFHYAISYDRIIWLVRN